MRRLAVGAQLKADAGVTQSAEGEVKPNTRMTGHPTTLCPRALMGSE